MDIQGMNRAGDAWTDIITNIDFFKKWLGSELTMRIGVEGALNDANEVLKDIMTLFANPSDAELTK